MRKKQRETIKIRKKTAKRKKEEEKKNLQNTRKKKQRKNTKTAEKLTAYIFTIYKYL